MKNKALPLKVMSIDKIYNGDKLTYVVPIYQRNYAWEKDEISALIQDVYDAFIVNKQTYYIGTLVSFHKGDQIYEIIDGQQRLTTLTIFIRALLNILKERCIKETEIEIDFDSKEKIYFRNGGNIKLRPVEYDRACFETLIVEGKPKAMYARVLIKKRKGAK